MTTSTPTVPSIRLSARAAAAAASPVRALLALAARPDLLSLAPGLPAAECLREDAVAALVPEILGRPGPHGPRALQYGPTEGDPDLRALLAARAGRDTEDVLVTAGSQQALDLLARLLADAGECVVVEAPTYVGALQALRANGVRAVGVPGDAGGLRVDLLERALRRGLRPRACYVVARFANPSGAVLAPDRARRLRELAERYGFAVVDDGAYGDLSFGAVAAAGDGDDLWEGDPQVIRLGTASKTLAPGLRVGWMVAPPEIVAAAARLKQSADLHTASLSQLVVHRLLADDDGHRCHLGRVRALLARRAAALRAALGAHAADALEVPAVAGGMFLWVRLRDPRLPAAAALLPAALAAGVAVVPGDAFHPSAGGERHMRLAFAALPEDHLAEAARRLGAVLAQARRSAA